MPTELHYYIILTFIIGLVVGYYFYKNPMGCGVSSCDNSSSSSCSSQYNNCPPMTPLPTSDCPKISGTDVLRALTDANLID